MASLLHGTEGRPLHPPRTDVVIGGYTLADFLHLSYRGLKDRA